MFEPNIVTLVHELAHVGGPSKPIFFGSTSLDISLSSFWGQPKNYLNIARDNVLFRGLPSKYFSILLLGLPANASGWLQYLYNITL